MPSPDARRPGKKDEKLEALKKHHLETDITRMNGDLASAAVADADTMKNAMAQKQRDPNDVAQQY